jgi:hypothetical protein
MSQAYSSFSCSKLTTHCTPDGFITVICFDEWVQGIFIKNVAASGTSNVREDQLHSRSCK